MLNYTYVVSIVLFRLGPLLGYRATMLNYTYVVSIVLFRLGPLLG